MIVRILVAVWVVEGPVALALDGVEDQSRLAAELFPLAVGALAETVLALALRPHLAGLVARPEGVAGVGGLGGFGRLGRLGAAVIVVLVADWAATALHSVRPVAPLVVWVVEQLLVIFDVADLLLRDALVALVVLDTVVRVGEESIVGWTGEVDGGWVGLAGTAVAVSIAAAHVLREVAPLVHVVVQVVVLAQQVLGAALVTLPVPVT